MLVFSADDSGKTLRGRIAWTCCELAIDPAAIAPWLRVVDATEGAPVLFAELRGHRSGTTTHSCASLRQFIAANAVDVLIVDNASDAFDADEIHRSSVRQFMRSLALLVRPRAGAVLLLVRVDKSTSRAGASAGSESYSGSTAWHNSARPGLFFREASSPGHVWG